MKIALLEFGAFSSFNKIMSNGRSLLENNIIELNTLFNHAELDLYVLTDKRADDKELIEILKTTLTTYNVTLKLLHFWDDMKDVYGEADAEATRKYMTTFNTQQYGYAEHEHPYGYDNKKTFNAGNLWFRRYVNFNLFDDFQHQHNLSYDFICMTRIFSTKIIVIKNIEFEKDYLYYSIDTFFMGNYENMKKLFDFGKHSLFYNENNHMNLPRLLDNHDFMQFSRSHDSCIGTHIFSSEIQILYYMYCNFTKLKTLRFIFPTYIHHPCIFNLVYEDTYDDSNEVRSIFNESGAHLYISISR